MPTPVHGKYCVLEIYVIDTWLKLLCGTDITFNMTHETIYKTGPNSGLWRQKVLGLSEWNASVTGLTMVDVTADTLTFFYTLQESVWGFTKTIRLTFQDEDGVAKQISGDAVITSHDINGPVEDFSNGVIVFEGTGAISIASIPALIVGPKDVYSDYWQTVNGNNYIQGASFIQSYQLGINDTILEVDMEGMQFDVVVGTPVNRECKFDSGNGRITFPADLIFDGNQRVFVEFKRPI